MIATPIHGSTEAKLDQTFCRKALEYYEVIAARYHEDDSMRDIAAAAYHRIGFIRTILKETNAKAAV